MPNSLQPRTQRWICGLIWLGVFMGVLPLIGRAESGVIRTKSSESIAGEILLDGGEVQIRPTSGAMQRIQLDQLELLRFQRTDIPPAAAKDPERPSSRSLRFSSRNYSGTISSNVLTTTPWTGVSSSATEIAAAGGSVAFEGLIVPVVTGKHQFFLRSWGAARLWIKGQLISSIDATNSLRESSSDIALTAEQRYPFVLEFDPAPESKFLKLEWTAPGLSRSIVPLSRIVHNPSQSPKGDLSKGLLGTYYGNPDFSNPRLIRIDRTVDFKWKTNAPFPDAGVLSRFSARWTGEFEVPQTGSYRFAVDTEGGVKVFAVGERIYERFEDIGESPVSIGAFPVTIEAGKRHKIRIEFFNEVKRATVRVGFWAEEFGKAPIFSERIYPDAPPDQSAPVRVEDGQAEPSPQTVLPGVLLADGSFYAAIPESGSTTQLRFSSRSLVTQLPIESVSRIYFASAPLPTIQRLDSEHSGVLLHAGDFLEGDLLGLNPSEIKLGSILFGNRGVERERVLAVVMRAALPTSTGWILTLWDGSAFRFSRVTLKSDGIAGSGVAMGDVVVPLAQVAELRRAGSNAASEKPRNP